MTLLSLAGPRTFAALMLMITGGSAVTLNAAPSYTPASPQPATQGAGQYAQYPQANVTVPPVQPQRSPYAVTTQPTQPSPVMQQQAAQQPMAQQPVAQQQTVPQAAVQNYRVAQNLAPGGYQMPNYQMPPYQSPQYQA